MYDRELPRLDAYLTRDEPHRPRASRDPCIATEEEEQEEAEQLEIERS